VDWFSFLAGALLASIVSALAGVLQKSGYVDVQQEALEEAHEQGYQAGLAVRDAKHAAARTTAMTLNVNQRQEINRLRDERDSLLQRNMRLVQECRELHTRLDLAHEAVGKGEL
jgi:hypothetical protein